MSQEEGRFRPSDPEFAFLGVAGALAGRMFENSDQGYTEAIATMQARHQQVMPRYTPEEVEVLVRRGEPVEIAEALGELSLDRGEFADAMFFGHQLYAYGEVDRQRDLGNQAFQTSLRFHRSMAEEIERRFGEVDPYLRMSGRETLVDAQRLREVGDEEDELRVLRGLVGVVALNGTLGEEAKENVDPMAIMRF